MAGESILNSLLGGVQLPELNTKVSFDMPTAAGLLFMVLIVIIAAILFYRHYKQATTN